MAVQKEPLQTLILGKLLSKKRSKRVQFGIAGVSKLNQEGDNKVITLRVLLC